MHKRILVILAWLLVLFLASCVPKAAPSSAPAPSTQAPLTSAPASAPAPVAVTALAAAPAKAAWEVEWEKVVAAAKQEGRVVLYTSLGGEQRQIITKPFETKYGVRIESVSGGSSENTTKILAEQRAGIYSGDVWISGSATYLPLKGALERLDPALILPELTNPELIKKAWYFGELTWASEAHTALISLMKFTEPISTNTNLVKSGEVTTYRDLLNPKWKGQMSLQDPRVDGMGRMWFAAALELGDVDTNYMRELATNQELFITRDRRLQVDWLARGKHAIAIAPYTATVTEFIGLGAPINRFNLGTPFVSGSTSGISMLTRAPHPNAAKLFINWLLSQEGQIFHSQAVGAQAQRLDVPTSHLGSAQVLKPGLKVYRADNEEFSIKRDAVYSKLAKEVYGP